MTEHQDTLNFAGLFKRYRLRSQIDTLSRFGDLFAEEGMIYENSLFTRWQNGQRIPRDRRTLLALIRLFVKRKGIVSLEEANGLLESVGLCDLNAQEINNLGTTLLDLNKKNIYAKRRSVNSVNLINFNKSYTESELAPIKIFQSRYLISIILIFIFHVIWNFRIQSLNLYNSVEAYIWGVSFSVISFSSFLYYLYCKFNTSKNRYPRSIVWLKIMKYLSLGLLFQWFGIQIWTFYNLIGIQVPYPSVADLGYFSTTICYFIASWYLLIANIPFLGNIFTRKKNLLLLSPLVLLFIISVNYIHLSKYTFDQQIKLIFDFLYPFIEITTLFISISTLVFSQFLSNNIKRRNVLFLFAFACHFFTDYIFVISVRNSTYSNGGYNDFLYLISHVVMTIAVISIRPLITSKLSVVNSSIYMNRKHTNLFNTLAPLLKYLVYKFFLLLRLY